MVINFEGQKSNQYLKTFWEVAKLTSKQAKIFPHEVGAK